MTLHQALLDTQIVSQKHKIAKPIFGHSEMSAFFCPKGRAAMKNNSDLFDYYYGGEAEQYSFYRIPKLLFTDNRFKGLSCEAKVLYGLMLDRMDLSMKNGWVDDKNRVYIYFTLDDAQSCLRCGHDKGVKLFAELDSKGIGLIQRVKQGLGKPARIYVKNFIRRETEVKTSEKPKSRVRFSGSKSY